MAKQKNGTIQFNYLERSFYLPERTGLKEFILGLFKKEGFAVDSVNYIFCSDDYLLKINQDFLGHNSYTDIITFQYNQQGTAIYSDIYISINRVKENARLFHTSFIRELYRVLFHGALHLCGYKDKTDKDVRLMRSKEEFYLAQYVSRGTKKRKRSHI